MLVDKKAGHKWRGSLYLTLHKACLQMRLQSNSWAPYKEILPELTPLQVVDDPDSPPNYLGHQNTIAWLDITLAPPALFCAVSFWAVLPDAIPASGHDLITFSLHPPSFDTGTSSRDREHWSHINRDVFLSHLPRNLGDIFLSSCCPSSIDAPALHITTALRTTIDELVPLTTVLPTV